MQIIATEIGGRVERVESMLRWYKRWISPMFRHSCRFTPTCSEYTAQAVVELGWWRGIFTSVRRLLRCHPFGGSGYDPVPHGFHSEQLRP